MILVKSFQQWPTIHYYSVEYAIDSGDKLLSDGSSLGHILLSDVLTNPFTVSRYIHIILLRLGMYFYTKGECSPLIHGIKSS